ncbi:MAG: penicillin-binding transpeptidase domain-containing protein [Bryobacteraceae bacterium]
MMCILSVRRSVVALLTLISIFLLPLSAAPRKKPLKGKAKTAIARVSSKRPSKAKLRTSAKLVRASAPRWGQAKWRKAKSSKRSRSRGSVRTARRDFVAGGPWYEPTFADSTIGDNIDGEDLTVRRAAVEALGPYNGSVVVADAQNGRILSVVNQKVAFRSGFQPCSTIKIVAALAGLSEGVIDRGTHMHLYGRTTMNLTDALASSNNPYFANIGVRLGYDKIAYYARLFGLGEKAGFNIRQETAGSIPDGPPANGGMGMMMSFGEGIKLTPLQLTALLSSIANGGTLYWLQHPRTQEDAANLVPRIKRQLDIGSAIPELKPGLLGAVEYGTARRAIFDPIEPIAGKTGTCTDRATPTHLGWFGSFNEVGPRRLVVVVLLTGGRPVNGPVASGIAGMVYRNLSQLQYFAKDQTISSLALSPGAFF